MNIRSFLAMGLLASFVLLFPLAALGQGGPTLTVHASPAPNVYGSPSWAGYRANALTALENDSPAIEDPATTPTAYYRVRTLDSRGNIVTSFPSWLGYADPGTRYGAAFASELGNRLTFGVHILGNGSKVRLSNLVWNMHSSDPGNTFTYAGSFSGTTYDGLSGRALGIDYGADLAKGGGDDLLITTGPADQLVDEIVFVGRGSAWDTQECAGTDQEQLDCAAAWYTGIEPFTLTTDYVLMDDAQNRLAMGTATVFFTEAPLTAPDLTVTKAHVGDFLQGEPGAAAGTYVTGPVTNTKKSSSSPAGFGPSAWQASASAAGQKSEMYVPATSLFGHPVYVSEIASISWWTNKAAGDVDWYNVVYTVKQGAGDSSSWYRSRLTSEPQYSGDTYTPSAWKRWSTGDATHPLRYFDSPRTGIYGTYADPTWTSLTSGPVAWSAVPGYPPTAPTWDYTGEQVLYFSMQTGSAWANGFTGLLDGLTVTLTTGEVATVNFEGQASTFLITVKNVGTGPTGGTVSVFDTLPAGMTAVSFSGDGWTTDLATLTATRSDVLAPGASYPPLVLKVAVSAGCAPSVTNAVSVAAADDTNPANDSASDLARVQQVPTHLAFSPQPADALPGALLPAFAVEVRDAGEQVVADYVGSITLALAGGTPGAALTGGGSTAALSGSASFPGLSVDLVGADYLLEATGTGGLSGTSALFDINNATPALTTLSPSQLAPGQPGFTLTVDGTGFLSGATIYWNGAARATTFVSATRLTATISAADVATVGSFPVTAQNPAPTAGPSNALSFTVATPATVWVDDDWAGSAPGATVGGHTFGYDAFAVIQSGVDAVATSGTVNVLAGTYLAEVTVPRAMLLRGAGIDQAVLVGRKDTGGSNTLTLAASGVTVEGFTVTRDGNNTTDWASNVKVSGAAFAQGTTGSTLRYCKVTGNRNGVYLNNTQGQTVRNNLITFNRTGIHLVNDCTGTLITQNEIVDNWTVGLLFNTVFPGETAATASLTASGNAISGNWYGEVQCRWTLSTATLDVSANWLGTTAVTTNPTPPLEPGYIAQIPTAYGGAATNPGGAPTIGGATMNRIDYTPWLHTGTDTDGGTLGFQGDFSYLHAGPASPQAGAAPRIAEAIGLVTAGGTVALDPGTFTENVVLNKTLTLQGGGEALTTLLPSLSAPNPCSGSSLCPGASNIMLVQANNVTIRDLTLDGDNPTLTSGIVRGGADLDARNGIITNHAAGSFTNLEVHHTTVRNIYLRGMYASSGGTFNFHHNTVTNVQGDGGSIGMFAWYGPGTMADNSVSACNDGVSANHSRGIQFLRNTVSGSGSGVHTDNAGDGGGVADLIQGNTITNCDWGIFVFVPYLAPTVEDNTVTGGGVGIAAAGGAFSGPTRTTLFRGNTVTGTSAPGSVGFYLSDTTWYWGETDNAVSLENNTFRQWDRGLQVETLSHATTLGGTGNALTDNAVGLEVLAPSAGGTPAVTFDQNAIYGNTSAGASNLSAATASLSCVWWGTATGPLHATLNPAGGGNSLSGPATFVPWSTTAGPAYTCDGYVPPALSSVDLTGPYTAGVSGQFHVSADNPALGAAYAHVRFDFTLSGTVLADITAFDYTVDGGTTWLPMPLSQSGADVTGYFGPPTGFPMPVPYSATSTFRITFATARSYPVTLQLTDLDAGGAVRATLTATVVANPGAPVITTITDENACAQDGVRISYTAGAGASSHDLYSDGSRVVVGYLPGALYSSGDTASHSYVVRAVGGASFADSAPYAFADVNDTPQAVTNLVVDNPDCSGARITFTANPDPAVVYELWVDGALAVAPFVSGGGYTPADALPHSYVVRSVKNSCFADVSPVVFAVVNLLPPRVTDSLMVAKIGDNMLLSWALILSPGVVDYYQVGRFIPQPEGPPAFQSVIGTASGQVNGIQVTLSGEPADAMYLVRAVKGNCYGPWN